MNYFLFVINNTEEEFEKRIKSKQWPFYETTKNIRNLNTGDKIVFYQAGSDKHQFAGDAKIGFVKNTSEERKITLHDISKWKKPVDIKKIYDNLEIIKKKECFGVYLVGGIKKLTSNDYKTIIKNSCSK